MKKSFNKYLLLLLFIPVVIAAWLLWGFSQATDSVTEIVLSSQALGEKVFTEDQELVFYSSLVSSAEEIEEAARPTEEYEKISMTVKNITGGEARYTLLLSPSPADCLYTDADGKLYRIEQEKARELLLSEGMDYVNPYYAFPTITAISESQKLSLSEGQTASWHTQKPDGTYLHREQSSQKSPVLSLPEGKTVQLAFSLTPGWNRVTVKKGDLVLFDDSADHLSSFVYSGDGDLEVSVQAKWNQTTDCKYYGEATASFILRSDAAPQFLLSAESAPGGELLSILAKNCLNGEVSLSSTLIGAEKAKVFDYGGEKVFLLPVALENKPGDYEITLTGEGVSQTLSFRVTEKKYTSMTIKDVPLSQLQAAREQENRQLEQLMEHPGNEKLWKEAFSVPVSGEDSWPSSPFGRPIEINGSDTGLRHLGIDYVDQPQSFVAAANDGIVVFAGQLPHSGNTVVLDHGMGIYSIYGGLESISVTKDTSLVKSQTVGTLGNTGITGASNLHFEIRVLGISVNPYNFLGKNPDFFDLNLNGI